MTASSPALPARPPGRPRDERAAGAILDATVDLLVTEGFAGVTVDAVAARAGVSKATIYRRWCSKEALLLAAAGCAAMTGPVPDTGSLRGDLLELFAGLSEGLRDGATGLLMPHLVAEGARNADVRELLAEFTAERRQRLLVLLDRAVERGELDADVDRTLVGDCLVGPIFYRHLLSGAAIDAAYGESVVDLVLAGLGARPGAQPD